MEAIQQVKSPYSVIVMGRKEDNKNGVTQSVKQKVIVVSAMVMVAEFKAVGHFDS